MNITLHQHVRACVSVRACVCVCVCASVSFFMRTKSRADVVLELKNRRLGHATVHYLRSRECKWRFNPIRTVA